MLDTFVRDPDIRPLDADSDAESTRLSPIQAGQGPQCQHPLKVKP